MRRSLAYSGVLALAPVEAGDEEISACPATPDFLEFYVSSSPPVNSSPQTFNSRGRVETMRTSTEKTEAEMTDTNLVEVAEKHRSHDVVSIEDAAMTRRILLKLDFRCLNHSSRPQNPSNLMSLCQNYTRLSITLSVLIPGPHKCRKCQNLRPRKGP